MSDRRIARVILWANGMVMVCDADGDQIPEYQGRFADVVQAIRRAAPEATWQIGSLGSWLCEPFTLKDVMDGE